MNHSVHGNSAFFSRSEKATLGFNDDAKAGNSLSNSRPAFRLVTNVAKVSFSTTWLKFRIRTGWRCRLKPNWVMVAIRLIPPPPMLAGCRTADLATAAVQRQLAEVLIGSMAQSDHFQAMAEGLSLGYRSEQVDTIHSYHWLSRMNSWNAHRGILHFLYRVPDCQERIRYSTETRRLLAELCAIERESAGVANDLALAARMEHAGNSSRVESYPLAGKPSEPLIDCSQLLPRTIFVGSSSCTQHHGDAEDIL